MYLIGKLINSKRNKSLEKRRKPLSSIPEENLNFAEINTDRKYKDIVPLKELLRLKHNNYISEEYEAELQRRYN